MHVATARSETLIVGAALIAMSSRSRVGSPRRENRWVHAWIAAGIVESFDGGADIVTVDDPTVSLVGWYQMHGAQSDRCGHLIVC